VIRQHVRDLNVPSTNGELHGFPSIISLTISAGYRNQGNPSLDHRKTRYGGRVDWLNYHHLFYFWTVVREGSVSAAARKLRLAQPTVSGQLRGLEEALGVQLFHRRGKRLVLSDLGGHVYRYADEIFTLGRELTESLSGRFEAPRTRLVVGVADIIPKPVVQTLLEPALRLDERMRVTCYEDRHDRLLAELALYELDVVLTDAPVTAASNIRGYNHLLGECGVTLFARPELAARLRRRFPRSLDDVPFIVPIEHTSLRRSLTRWFDARAVRPRIRAEVQDGALVGALGQTGEGVFAAPSIVEDRIRAQLGVAVVARLEDVRERFYAITVERRIDHPAVRAITETARAELFAS
jgi:LysR family transcriptional activator of nhaA